MDYADSFRIAAAGMRLERLRVDVTATNIANMNTTRAAGGSPYRALKVVAHTEGAGSFGALMSAGVPATLGLPVAQVIESDAAPRLVHDPAHPDADAQGNVAFPAVDHLGEMLNLTTAMRAYEANLVVINATRVMATKALEIGGNS